MTLQLGMKAFSCCLLHTYIWWYHEIKMPINCSKESELFKRFVVNYSRICFSWIKIGDIIVFNSYLYIVHRMALVNNGFINTVFSSHLYHNNIAYTYFIFESFLCHKFMGLFGNKSYCSSWVIWPSHRHFIVGKTPLLSSCIIILFTY